MNRAADTGSLSSARECLPGQHPQKSIQMGQQRLRQLGRQSLSNRVLGSVGGAGPESHSPKVADRGIAQSIRDVGEEGSPAVGAALPGTLQKHLGIARRRQGSLIDGRSLVPGRSGFALQLQAR